VTSLPAAAASGALSPRWPWAALVILCLSIHGPALRGGFVYDDSWTILSNPAVRDPGNLLHLLTPGLARADIPDAGRPVMLASVMLDWWLWGRSPPGFHLQSLLWHIGVTLLLFAGLRRLTGRSGLALVAAALHAVHPLHVEVVAAINYREDLLATFFLLAALATIARARARPGAAALGWRALAAVAMLIACLSKESAYLGLLLLVVLDVWRGPAPGLRALWRGRADFLVMALPALVAFGWRWWVFRAPAVVSGTAELPAERFERWRTLLAGGRFFVTGLAQYLWPARLSPEYAPPSAGGMATALAVAALVGLALGAALVLRTMLTRRSPPDLAGLGFLWALVAYLPHLGLVPLTNLRADRYFYLPGLGLALLLASLGDRALGHPRLSGARPLGVPLAAAAAAVAVLLLGARSWRQGRVWRDDGSLFLAAARAQPGAPRAWRGLANSALHAGRTLEALAAVDRALALRDDAHGRELRGLILMRQGALSPARAELLRALAGSGPGHRPRVLNNLGFVELELAEVDRALERFAQARRLAPAFDRPWLNAARAHLQRGQAAEAGQLLRGLVAQIPGSIDGWAQLAALHEREGRTDEALAAWRRALSLSRGDATLAANLRRLQAVLPRN
jgi:tetratricopeptide (TPR) repeat protein